MKNNNNKRRYKISYKRLAVFIACVILICCLIGLAIYFFFFAGSTVSTAKPVSVAAKTDTLLETTSEHEQRLNKAMQESPLVKTAVPNIGYKGGKKFWKYCGYYNHIDWCACFVSWCSGQNGYIAAGKIEEFAYVPYGYNWFKEKKRFKKVGYKPSPGNIIFFDWNADGDPNHVGIVEYYNDGTVYTVEGNRDDTCVEKHYPLNCKKILGYGIIKE